MAGPAVLTARGDKVVLRGDTDTMGVLQDARLTGTEIEAVGRFTAPGHLTVDPIHTFALFAWRNGKKFSVTYWCDVCAIRTYTPGKCQCCQEETELRLVDPAEVGK